MDRKQVLKTREVDITVSNYGTTRQKKYDIVLLPWGATEPHNYHLPYLTDCILSHDIAVAAAVKASEDYGVRAMVMPPVTFGSQNPGQRELAFCVYSRYETQFAILTDIVASLYCQGMRKLLIINGHGGNSFKNMIRDLTIDFPDFVIATSEWFKMAPANDCFDNPGDHADELETSVMMHYHPELVDISEAGEGKAGSFSVSALKNGAVWIPRNWGKVSTDTGIGDPRAATAEKGEKFTAAVVTKYAEFLRDFLQKDLYEILG